MPGRHTVGPGGRGRGRGHGQGRRRGRGRGCGGRGGGGTRGGPVCRARNRWRCPAAELPLHQFRRPPRVHVPGHREHRPLGPVVAPEERLRLVRRHLAQLRHRAVGVARTGVQGGEDGVPQPGPGVRRAYLLGDDRVLGAHGRGRRGEAPQPPGLPGQDLGERVGGGDGVEDGVVAVGLRVAHAARLLDQGDVARVLPGAAREHQVLHEVGRPVPARRIVVAARPHRQRHGHEPPPRHLLDRQREGHDSGRYTETHILRLSPPSKGCSRQPE